MEITLPIVCFRAACWFLIFLFGFALYHKLRDWQRFNATVAAYQLVPVIATPVVAVMIALMEALIITALLLEPLAGLIGAAASLALYVVAISINLIRRRYHIDCGCGDEPVSLSHSLVVWRLVLVALTVCAAMIGVPLESISFGVDCFALAIALLAWVICKATEQIVINRQRHIELYMDAI